VNTLLLVGLGVGEPGHLTTLAAKKTVQVGSDLVALALLQVVTLRTSCLAELELQWPKAEDRGDVAAKDRTNLEESSTLLGVA
jgi:hypothetical protein